MSSITSKVLECVIYSRISLCLDSLGNQFGFKTKHNTDMCIYALKETILKYRSLDSNVYCCFLNVSKAFDRVNHTLLFCKLLDRGVPVYIVRLLIFLVL